MGDVSLGRRTCAPGEYAPDTGIAGEAVTSDNRAIYTAAKDHLAHILTCH
jgi:hypothetical protein